MDCMARFKELARFADDYVATDLAKVRRFENGLKLSIQARILGLRLQDMDSMVGTALTIEREIENARSTRDASVSSKRKDSQYGVLPLSAAWTHEEGLSPETGILGFWDSKIPVSSRTGEDTVRSSTARYRREESVSVSGSYTGTSHFTGRPEARVWVEAEDEAHRQGHQGSKGVSTPSHRRLSQQISQLYRVWFCYLAYG